MPADTAAKRYSAMNIKSPWRRLSVVPDAAIPLGERQAAMRMYSGILASGPVVSGLGGYLTLLGVGSMFLMVIAGF